MPGLLCPPLLDRTIEVVEGRSVLYPPALPRETAVEIPVIGHSLVATAEEVSLHVREVGIASIEEVGRIAYTLELPCDTREGTALGRHLHHRVSGEARVATQGGEYSAVCAVAIGIALAEDHTLTSEAVEVGGDVGHPSEALDILCSEALEDDEDYVGSLRA